MPNLQVKLRLPHKHNDFMEILKRLKSKAPLNIHHVVARIISLFRPDHPDLIAGFGIFLPHGYRIEVISDAHQGFTTSLITPQVYTTL